MSEVAALNIKVATADIKKAQTDLAALEKSGAGAEKSMHGLTNVAAKLAAALAGLGAATFIKEASMLAARYETLGVVMVQAGKNAGYGSDQMRKFEKDLRAQGIAAIEARQNLAKMAAAQMDLAQSGDLASAAQNLAVVGGINSSEAFSRMTQGIQSAEVEVLRTIGLNVSWEESYKRVAAEMGKSADKLTVQEKLQARVNEVLKRAKEYNGIYEESMKTAGKQISSFTRYWQDMQVDLGNSELPAVTTLVQEATKRIKEFTEYIKKEDTQKALSAIGNTAVLAFDTVAKLASQIGPLFISVLDGYNRLPDIMKEVGLVGVILGGRQGKLILASLTLFSSVASSLAKIQDAKAAFGNEGISYFSREDLNKQAEFARSMEGIEQSLARVRKEIASGAGVSVYADENEAHIKKLRDEEARLVGMLAESSGMKALQAKENDIRAAQARIYGGVGFIPEKVKEAVSSEKSKAEINRIATATASLTSEIAKANDVADEGAGKLSDMHAKYEKYAKILGVTNPLVSEYAMLVQYANEHNGRMPSEVAKVNNAIEENIELLNEEIHIRQVASALYDDEYTSAISMMQARLAARKAYVAAISNGADETVAAHQRVLAVSNAQLKIDEQRAQAAKGLAATFSGPAYDATVAKTKSEYSDAREIADDKFAVESELQTKLNELESARLLKSRTAYGGMKAAAIDYYESTRNIATDIHGLFTGAFSSMEDSLVNFVTKGKLEFKDLANSIIADIARIAIRQSITGPLFGALAGGFSGLFSANGNVLSGPGISALSGGVYNQPTAFGYNQHMTAFANGGVLGEAGPEAVMPLARTSDGKLGVRTTDEGKSGGTQTVTVIMKDAKGNQTAAPMQFNTNGMREFILNVVRDGSERGLLGSA